MTNNHKLELTAETQARMPDAAFAALGDGVVAYVRAISSDDLKAAFPAAPDLEPGLALWALLGADGTPILVTDSRDAAIANAMQHELVAVSVH
ncbi:BQ00720 family protein [Methylobrevis albus]|uniref:DUF1150 domain-containing protein n=1 Tax=Methylobrevis albus TaxID=2793297 RepID=A0A931I1R5_9HYPH|nr:DUF1150 domain-containing protein [Methylobrevis albus]MBH0238682.1 DUF1150 domain-containing protein [Methylobrevis albus]